MPKGIFSAKRGKGKPFEKGHKYFRTPEGLKINRIQDAPKAGILLNKKI